MAVLEPASTKGAGVGMPWLREIVGEFVGLLPGAMLT